MPDADIHYWQPGDVVVLRYYETPLTARMVHAYMGDPASIDGIPFLAGGVTRTIMARPYVVIKDSPGLTALFQPEGMPSPRWDVASGALLDRVRTARGQSLRILYPGRSYDVTLFFETEASPWFYDAMFGAVGMQPGWRGEREALVAAAPDAPDGEPGRFRGWYVNLQTPYRRAGVCFDIADQVLDIVVRPDCTWYWKDEDELDLCISKGACTEAEAEAIRSAGRKALALVEAGAAPFDDGWSTWHPPADTRIKLEQIPDGWQFLPA